MAAFTQGFPQEWQCSLCGQWVSTQFSVHYHATNVPYADEFSDMTVCSARIQKTARTMDDPVRLV